MSRKLSEGINPYLYLSSLKSTHQGNRGELDIHIYINIYMELVDTTNIDFRIEQELRC